MVAIRKNVIYMSYFLRFFPQDLSLLVNFLLLSSPFTFPLVSYH